MLIDVLIAGDRNVIKKEAKKILKYKDVTMMMMMMIIIIIIIIIKLALKKVCVKMSSGLNWLSWSTSETF